MGNRTGGKMTDWQPRYARFKANAIPAMGSSKLIIFRYSGLSNSIFGVSH